MGALTSKNWTQKKVNVCRTTFEFIYPVIFGLLIGLGFSASNLNPSTSDIGSIVFLWLFLLIVCSLMFIQGVVFIMN